jgi:hypothetical protein
MEVERKRQEGARNKDIAEDTPSVTYFLQSGPIS